MVSSGDWIPLIVAGIALVLFFGAVIVLDWWESRQRSQ